MTELDLISSKIQQQKQRIWAIGLLVIFLALAISVKLQFSWVNSIDQGFARAFAIAQSSQLTAILVLLSKFGSPVVATILAVVLMLWLWFRKARLAAAFSFLVYFGGNALALLIKYMVGRMRPIHELIADSGFSFPSGHVFSSTLFILLLILVLRHYLDHDVWSLVNVVLVAWLVCLMVARVYLRNHFATDVFGSVLLATGWVFASQDAYTLLVNRFAKRSGIQGDD